MNNYFICCKECSTTTRYVGCHEYCDKYIKAKAEYLENKYGNAALKPPNISRGQFLGTAKSHSNQCRNPFFKHKYY